MHDLFKYDRILTEKPNVTYHFMAVVGTVEIVHIFHFIKIVANASSDQIHQDIPQNCTIYSLTSGWRIFAACPNTLSHIFCFKMKKNTQQNTNMLSLSCSVVL